MEDNGSRTEHDDRVRSQSVIPPPPSERPGWLSHTVLQPSEFPQSSVPYLYSLSHGDLPSISSSPAFNLHLLNTHPAYARPPAINGDSRSNLSDTSRYPLPIDPRITDGETQQPLPGQTSPSHHYDISGAILDQLSDAQRHIPPRTNGFQQSHDPNTVIESIETDAAWNTSFTELLEGSGSQAWHHQQNGFEPTPSYSADLFAPIPQAGPGSLPDTLHLTHYRTDLSMPVGDNDSEAEETDSEDEPGQNWPGRHRKRAAEDQPEDVSVRRPRKKQKQKQKQSTGEKKKGRKKGANVGPRPTMDPGDAFMKIYNQAVDTFLGKKDLDRAQTLVIEAISTNPEIFAAHSLLADIHFARGNHDAGIDVLMVGLHAHTNDVELWRQVADTILMHSEEVSQKRIERAMYCYGAIIRKNKLDLDARFQRAECARLLGIWNRAFSDLNMVMNDDPHNSAVLAQFAKLCQDVGDIPKAIITYEKHFDYYRTLGLSEQEHFTWQDIGTYVDLLLKQGETAEAMVKMKQLGRWLCGREDEVFWDEHMSDDRELDQMHYPRRLEEPRFIPNLYPEQDYGEAFPLDLRGKLGVIRLKLGYREEAQSHFDWLEPDLEGEESLVEEYSDTFYEIAKALHDAKEHEQALHFFKALYNEGIELSLDFYMDMGASCYICKEKEVAIELYLKVLQLDSDNIDARTELTKCYRDLGNKELAVKYGKEGVLMAQSMVSDETVVRKYERKEDRERREEAERALKSAFRLPDKGKNKPGKVPRGLRYRTRERRKFFKWVPDPTPSPEPTPEPRQQRYKVSRKKKQVPAARQTESPEVSSSESPEPVPVVEEPPMYDRPIKIPRKPGRPAKKKEARRPPRQENAVKHYEEMQQLYQTLLNHQEAMRDDDEVAISVWMDCANAMFQDFRSRRLFFPVTRHSKFTGYTNMEPQPRAATPASTGARDTWTPEGTPAEETSETNTARQRSVQAGTTIPKEAATAPDEYCGIRFAAWLDIFLELAVLHANSASPDGQTECYKLINACLDCSIYHHDDRAMIQIHACYLSCCVALGDDITLYNTVLRWFMREYAFCTDTYRLYSAITLVNELQPVPNPMTDAVFKSGPNQKFVFRQIISIDKMLPQDYNKDGPEGGVPAFMRRDREETKKLMAKIDRIRPADTAEDGDGDDATQAQSREVTAGLMDPKLHMPQEMDVVLFVLYAHIMMASGSFPNALSYLYRANCLDSHNTVCLLSIALCYMHELAKRQTENRHAYALAGWAWFGRYEEERLKWAEDLDRKTAEAASNDVNSKAAASFKMVDVARREIAFNKARCWEMLGMADLSMRGYKRVLDLAPKEKPVDTEKADKDEIEEAEEEWTMEAAYAMSVMYAMSGNTGKAREITERYLVVE